MADVVFVRFNQFDNSRCKREVELPEGTKHAWAVPLEFVEDFMSEYADNEPQQISPDDRELFTEGARLFVIDFELMDKYVMGVSEEIPQLIDFDPSLHCILQEEREVFCHCGCGKSEGIFTYYENPYQVLIIPEEIWEDSGMLTSDIENMGFWEISLDPLYKRLPLIDLAMLLGLFLFPHFKKKTMLLNPSF